VLRIDGVGQLVHSNVSRSAIRVGEAFQRAIRQLLEIFLRFTHRYWFHDISEQAAPKALFNMCAEHLGLDPLYAEVKERIHDMDEYLDSDSLRRQANTVVRLTVVTIFGLIGTITTGFLGMNILAWAVCAFGVFAVGRMIVLGSASTDGQGFRRDEEPVIYWTIVALGCAIVGFFFYIAIFEPFGP
jgi:hypothetical protein